MKPLLFRRLRPAVIVITGASSGIGRATAEAFAGPDVRLVLAARREEALKATAAACEARGAQALVVPTDVTDPEAVAQLAARAFEFGKGRIDVWVNNAGVGAVGLFEETPALAHDQVVRTNLLGYLHGAHAVLPHFKRAGAGTLINVVSLGAWAPSPYAVSYTASKYGLRGFSEALRAELTGWPRIQVCDIFPSVVDTPGFRHGANYTGKALKPPKPLYDARQVARAIVRAAVRRRHGSMTVGSVARFARMGNLLAPGVVQQLSHRGMQRYFENAPAVPVTEGNLFEPSRGSMSIDGGWRGAQRGRAFRCACYVVGLAAFALTLWASGRRDGTVHE